MSHDPKHAALLIRETDNRPEVSHTEREYRNALQAASDEITRLNQAFALSAAALEAGEKERHDLLSELFALRNQTELLQQAKGLR